MVATFCQESALRPRRESGFTLIELLVATVVTTLVLGGAVALTSQMQNGYRRQIESAVAEQEGRYALDWIGRYIRGVGSNPFDVTSSECPANPTTWQPIILDPNLDGVDSDIRLMTDSNPPDGLIGGTAGACTQLNEDVIIRLDAANDTIVFEDQNGGSVASTRTDRVIENLRFIYRDADRNPTTVPANVWYVETQITIRTRTLDPSTGAPVTRLLSSDIKVRNR